MNRVGKAWRVRAQAHVYVAYFCLIMCNLSHARFAMTLLASRLPCPCLTDTPRRRKTIYRGSQIVSERENSPTSPSKPQSLVKYELLRLEPWGVVLQSKTVSPAKGVCLGRDGVKKDTFFISPPSSDIFGSIFYFEHCATLIIVVTLNHLHWAAHCEIMRDWLCR